MDREARERLRAELEGLDNVLRAVLDPDPLRVFVIADRSDHPTEMLVHSVLARNGIAPADAEVRVAYLPQPGPRRRVRFLDARVQTVQVGRAEARVELEWSGAIFSAAAEGESGPAMELRLVARATLRALEAVLENRIPFRLLGIKSFRAFDHELIVGLLRSEEAPPLIGAALTTDDPHRSAALAVLNATNRVLGNYLLNPEGEPAGDGG